MERTCGILLPISSLPSPYGIGTLGSEAFRFVDFLRDAGCTVWQLLPMQPTTYGDSPYQACAANALNPYFIDLDFLCRAHLLTKEECRSVDWGDNPLWVDYGKIYRYRLDILRLAFSRFDRANAEWTEFLAEGKYSDFALFMALKAKFGGAPYTEWGEYSVYDREKLIRFTDENENEVEFWQFTQYLFIQQWRKLKEYANAHGVRIMGDMSLYVGRDSVEMWKYGSEMFLLDEKGNPAVQAGVPTDAFSSTGQLWGNPIYDWEKMKKDNYSWWRYRIHEAFRFYDILRIDHFTGFVKYYCVPPDAKDATVGEWRSGPGPELFRGLEYLPIVAENLGVGFPEVRRALRELGYPGMRILQYGFDGDPANEHKPSNYPENVVAYTGTHDNQTLYSMISELDDKNREIFISDLKKECAKAGIPARIDQDGTLCLTVLRLLLASRARLVIFPLQDAIRMGNEGRVNRPSTVSPENWTVRLKSSDFSAALKRRLAGMAAVSKRIHNS